MLGSSSWSRTQDFHSWNHGFESRTEYKLGSIDIDAMDITVRRWCESIPNNFASWCNGNTGDFGSLVPGSNPGEATNLNVLWIIYRGVV